MIRGELVDLRPLAAADIERSERTANDPDDNGPFDVENVPEQRALEHAGCTREGVLRRAQWRSGEWRDIVLYSKLRGE